MTVNIIQFLKPMLIKRMTDKIFNPQCYTRDGYEILEVNHQMGYVSWNEGNHHGFQQRKSCMTIYNLSALEKLKFAD